MELNNAKIDAETMLNALLPFAKKMLTENREFFPFGAQMAIDGKITDEGASDGTEQPRSMPLIDLLNDAHKSLAKAGKLRTCAVIYDIRTVPPERSGKQDAIAAAIDHVSGYSVVVIFPYAFDVINNLVVEPPFAVKGAGVIFG